MTDIFHFPAFLINLSSQTSESKLCRSEKSGLGLGPGIDIIKPDIYPGYRWNSGPRDIKPEAATLSDITDSTSFRRIFIFY